MRPKSETISFRVNVETALKIDRARKAYRLSRGEWIRGFVINKLHEVEGQGPSDDNLQLLRSVGEVKEASGVTHLALKRLAFILLNNIGNLEPDDARKLARRLFEDSPNSD